MTELSNQIDAKAFELRQELVTMIQDRATNTPRSLQRELGPSDFSHPCMRRLAYGIMEVERSNPEFDCLPSVIGTAVHSWLDDTATRANNQLGRIRWLTETRVNPTDWLSGSSDLFDLDTGTVIDHKVLGAASFKKNKKSLNIQYRNQIQIYGLGFERAGHTVNHVGAMLIPKSGLLTGAYLHLEPYNRAHAEAVLARRETVLILLNDLRVEENPEMFKVFEKSGPSCMFCKYFAPNPQTPLQCEGVDDDY